MVSKEFKIFHSNDEYSLGEWRLSRYKLGCYCFHNVYYWYFSAHISAYRTYQKLEKELYDI